MFYVKCTCGASVGMTQPLEQRATRCPQCKRLISCITAEPLTDPEAATDFGAALTIAAGPERRGHLLALGGCAPIVIGAAGDCAIRLPGPNVSRHHCSLSRIEVVPPRWQIHDLQSEVGLFVNGHRVVEHELRPGDVVDIGAYELHFELREHEEAHDEALEELSPVEEEELELELAPLSAPAPGKFAASHAIPMARVATPAQRMTTPTAFGPATPLAAAGPGLICPCCNRQLAYRARVCVDCGINVPSGRPLITSEELDENAVHANTGTVVMFLSWLVWVTPLPIPVASAAYGRFRPLAIRAIAILTTLVSVIFLAAVKNDGETSMRRLMLWPPGNQAQNTDDTREQARKILEQRELRGIDKDAPLTEEEINQLAPAIARAESLPFEPWQLLTHALLHDPSGWVSFATHLGGNMLFLLVFGSRVNAIIGNLATAIVYPILAICSGLIYLVTLPPDSYAGLLGASGAISGLAGMYFILLPAHPVYCAMWVRIRIRLFLKIFTLRGLWVVLIYFIYDIVMATFFGTGSVAHWAHIGGFVTGAVIGLGMLSSRQFKFPPGDLLSVSLGKWAWPIVGRPVSSMITIR